MTEKLNKCRINAYISENNYRQIDELMKEGQLLSRTLSKGGILDLALTNFFKALECGETLENMAIQHLETLGEDVESDLLNTEGDENGF